jgi:hypothetical protein
MNICFVTQKDSSDKSTDSVASVLERTIATDRPPIVSEVSALRMDCFAWYRDGSLRPYSRFRRPEPLLFFQVVPQLYSRG